MCYSFRTSVISFSIAILSSLLAFYWKMPIIGCLILFYCQIQLGEAMIWKGLDDNNKKLNRIGTLYIKYSLPSHNIGIAIGILLSVILIEKRSLIFKDYLPLIIAILFYIIVLFIYGQQKDKEDETYPRNGCSDKGCQNNENRLNWKFPTSWYIISFVISLIFLFVYIKPLKSKIFISTMYTLALIVSFVLYPKNGGTVWCFSSAVLAPIVVIGCKLLG